MHPCEADEEVVEERREEEAPSVLVEEVAVVALAGSLEVEAVLLPEVEVVLEEAFREGVVERLFLRRSLSDWRSGFCVWYMAARDVNWIPKRLRACSFSDL